MPGERIGIKLHDKRTYDSRIVPAAVIDTCAALFCVLHTPVDRGYHVLRLPCPLPLPGFILIVGFVSQRKFRVDVRVAVAGFAAVLPVRPPVDMPDISGYAAAAGFFGLRRCKTPGLVYLDACVK